MPYLAPFSHNASVTHRRTDTQHCQQPVPETLYNIAVKRHNSETDDYSHKH